MNIHDVAAGQFVVWEGVPSVVLSVERAPGCCGDPECCPSSASEVWLCTAPFKYWPVADWAELHAADNIDDEDLGYINVSRNGKLPLVPWTVGYQLRLTGVTLSHIHAVLDRAHRDRYRMP